MAGCLSYEQFVRHAGELVAASEQLGDGWELRHVRTSDVTEETTTFMVRKKSIFIESNEEKGDTELSTDIGEQETVKDEDPARLGTVQNPREAVTFEYHVIYSASYRVPVLYFTASYGNGRIVPLKEVWRKVVSPFHVTRDSGMEWESVTQCEHPILGQPFYHLHPCHTSSVMATALGHPTTINETVETSEGCHNTNYLLSWLSIFGPTVGLNISLKYNITNSKTL